MKMREISQAEYDSIPVKEPDTTYIITDTSPSFLTTNDICTLTTNTVQGVVTDIMSAYQRTTLYTCDYCGTDYQAESGFVPPCRNCGARLRRV